ncbi:NADH-dependent flavin oxidoreductase [Enterococcus hermanniensis]|uniref:NADH-dependent oxidoreductase n=1 Tax=Enterococcus hermanniensis TaxID=249189 RepID=A0A1L8TPI0_9ENTE|nr:NADH-dependent flavin oxidoreductase [Enterococcus hermanniensis]OJG46187.1 NADH-dependent oxidoreductase [Enterococcus hermanniensis]
MKHLTDSITLRHGATLTNRIVMSPMQTHSGKRDGFASDETVDYYSARSQAAGMLITEFHYVSKNGGPAYTPGYPEQLGAYSDEHLEGLSKVAKALKKDGNKAILQIHHAGRAAIGQAVSGEDVVAPSTIDFSFLDYPVRELTNEEILEIIADFGRATKRAIAAGFDGVEIHGANHYLIQQFFSKLSNHRTDQWGGNLEKRMAFPLAVVKEVKRVVDLEKPENFIIGYRISPDEIHGSEIGYSAEEATQLIAEVAKYELDYIHLSLWGGYDSSPSNAEKSYAKLFKDVLDEETKLIIVGGVFSEASAQDAVENYADLIAVARGTLVEPKFAQKIIENKGEMIYHEISPETIDYVKWTPGLKEAFSRKDSLGLPPLPGGESIQDLHTGRFDMFYKK